MGLRNKKTGEIINGGFVVCEYKDGARFSVKDKPCFDSLDELKEEWEDYKPIEPLIKDEEIRKSFREWAGLFGAERFRVNHFSDSRIKTTSIVSIDTATEPVIELPGHIGEESEIYTRVELCGEEEKPREVIAGGVKYRSYEDYLKSNEEEA